MKIKKPANAANQEIANDFCQFAEDVSSAGINLKRAFIN